MSPTRPVLALTQGDPAGIGPEILLKLLREEPEPTAWQPLLVAERVAIEAYGQMSKLIGDKDSTTRRMLESILSQEQEHADELSDWLD